MAKAATGQVLNVNKRVLVSGEGDVYLVFEDWRRPRRLFPQTGSVHDDIEFGIYDGAFVLMAYTEARRR